MDSNLIHIIVNNIVPLISIIGVAIAWLFDRKKRREEIARLKVENQTAEADALMKMRSVYNVFVSDVKVQMLEQKTQISELKKEITELKAENKKLIEIIKLLEIQIKI